MIQIYDPLDVVRIVPGVVAFCVLTVSAMAADHPRLYLTTHRIAQLKTEITGVRKAQWELLRKQADGLAARKAPAYKGPEQGDSAEQLWERNVGNALPTLAMAWLLTGETKFRDATELWSLTACGYPTWGFGEKYLDNDLAAAHLLFGLAMVYDWMGTDLKTEARETIHKSLLAHGRTMYRATDPVTGRSWRDNILQNHLWVAMTGLAAAAFAMPDEPETKQWLAVARDKFRQTEKALGPDGASHEGVAYWSYGVEYLLKYWALSADLTGEDLQSPWWRKTALYRIYLGLPQASWAPNNTIVDLADSTRQDYYGPDYLLFNLAHRFHDPQAQWLGLELERRQLITNNTAPFLNLLWFDPEQKAAPFNGLPTLRHFEDLGIVSARTDWSGKESLLVFKSGPPAGHEEVKQAFPHDPGFGHVHPDANHFVLFGNGEWLIEDDGYRWKETGQHNTLLIDGEGQMGEHKQWFGRKPPLPLQGEPAILKAESNARFDLVVGDATGAYAPDQGLQKFVRYVYFWKEVSAVVVIDNVEMDRAKNLELRFHPAQNAKVRIENLTGQGVTSSTGMVEGKNRDGKPFSQYTVVFKKNAQKWRNVTAIVWPDAGGTTASVNMKADGEHLIFQSADKTIRF